MLKKILSGLVLASLYASSYSIVVDVPNLKANGKNWDPFGGAPDILFKIDGETLPMDINCKNQYRCVAEFESDAKEWYIEVYDKDKIQDDIIARGNCSVGQTCEFNGLKMKITE